MSDVTRILERAQQGDAGAAKELLPLVYEELRHLAAIKMASQPAGHTLQPTALVHEAYLRLVKQEHREWKGSRHFYAVAAQAMRQILIDIARRKRRLKRGGACQHLDLDQIHLAAESDPDGLLAVNEALEDFTREYSAQAELVKLRFFTGLSLPQVAQTLGISLATAKRSWAFSRAWLYRRLTREN
ncbi:MAG: sigma-70 family RNA polymerase sigma factor [Verrucomicrobia bacterium]|nr:sigma-70 family RNA polymerase sigma factor [Verrucomicrobiota bacterium]